VAAAKEVVMKKKTADVAALKKATDDATSKKVTEEAVAQRAAEVEARKKAVEESMGFGSSPTLGVGSKRAATLGVSTTPSKWFRYAWKPQYVE
jgi:membrane protein involved in colicin uptake